LRGSYDNSQLRKAFPTLMVARLDGPDLKTAKRLIDDAIAVEKAGGLTGKAYIDARGLTTLEGPPHEPGSYPDYDRALLVTAKGLEGLKNESDEPRFEVTLNDEAELFTPGQCPDAALYCGWYSLGKYVDAFDWKQGAVAYHLASAETIPLHASSTKSVLSVSTRALPSIRWLMPITSRALPASQLLERWSVPISL
jgi:uncharacterized protein (TIGR03790 family)